MTFTVIHSDPWLVASFEAKQHMVSWSLNRPGYVRADTVAWLEVRNKDLPIGVDPKQLLRQRLEDAGMRSAVGLMTSRSISRYHLQEGRCGDTNVRCLTTLGLSNAEHIGHPRPQEQLARVGTINMLCHVSTALSEAAMLETLSMATQARTAALMDVGVTVAGTEYCATGTGTDCIVIACLPRPFGAPYAGMHTQIGQTLGKVVYETTRASAVQWVAENR